MSTTETFDPDERDWRLQARVDVPLPDRTVHVLHSLLGEHDVLSDLSSELSDEVVLTHDGQSLFAYAADRGKIDQARTAIESVLAREGVKATLKLTHFSQDVDEWVDPNAPAATGPVPGARAKGSETRTLVAATGREVREELEQSMRIWAQELGLRCEVHEEHPHLLRTQVAFTVTGPTRKVEEFASGLKAECAVMIRSEQIVMASPL